jgi:titin
MALQCPLTRARTFAAAAAALSLLASSATASIAYASSSTRSIAWFHDPVSATARAAEVNVPANPASSTGALRQTKATSRTRAGAVAVPLSWVAGHALVAPQAVVLPLDGLFRSDSAALTAAGRQAVVTLSRSLSSVRGLACEGYGDYAGNAAHILTLSRARAAAMCGLIHTSNPSVQTTSVGFGGSRPVTVGGRAADRRANTRMVFVVTKSTIVAPVVATPKLVSVTAGDRSIGIVFNAPTGGTPIYAYQVSTDGGAHWSTLDAVGDNPYTALLTGLTNGVQYDVMLRAVTSSGVSPSGAGQLSTPAIPPPSSPWAVNLGLPVAGDTTADLTFWAPAYSGGSPVTGYELSTDGGAFAPIVFAGTGPFTTTVTGLTNGTSYTFVVRAVNSIGSGTASNPRTVIPFTTADAPNLSTVVRGDASADLTFDAPAFDGGRPITGYEASTDGGTSWAPITTTGTGPFAATVGGLTNGTVYSVSVHAITVAGAGTASNTVSVTPATIPDAPNLTAAVAGDSSVDLTFSAPSDGGDAITGYDVTMDSGLSWQALSSSAGTATVSGLTNGTSYTFAVRAVNSVGPGAISNSIAATPVAQTLPGTPTITFAYFSHYPQWYLTYNVATATAITAVELTIDGATPFNLMYVSNGDATSYPSGGAILDCSVGHTYQIRVQNAAGWSPYSATVPVSPCY